MYLNLPPVLGIKSVFQDIVLNICINAGDALKTVGNKCVIQCYEIEKKIGADNTLERLVVIKIQDNGCGLSENQRKSIFDAYYSTKKDGTGIGLWMVNESIKSFGGTVSVESEKEHGTTFEIQLRTATNQGL